MRSLTAAIVVISSVATTTLVTAPLGAVPSCRDSKGMFTPCVGASASRVSVHMGRSRDTAGHGASAPPEAAAQRAEVAASEKSVRPALVRRAKSCRDSKGLFKPC